MTRPTLGVCSLALLALSACAPRNAEEPPVPPSDSVAAPGPTAAWDQLLSNPRQPGEGLLSGGQPSLEQLAAARDLGFRTVVNLRTEKEPGARREEVEALGLAYVELPIAGAADLDAESARAFAALLERAERPAIVHCGSGNRVGALFALKAYHVDGLEPDEAFAVGRDSGLTRLAGAVREHLELAAAE